MLFAYFMVPEERLPVHIQRLDSEDLYDRWVMQIKRTGLWFVPYRTLWTCISRIEDNPLFQENTPRTKYSSFIYYICHGTIVVHGHATIPPTNHGRAGLYAAMYDPATAPNSLHRFGQIQTIASEDVIIFTFVAVMFETVYKPAWNAPLLKVEPMAPSTSAIANPMNVWELPYTSMLAHMSPQAVSERRLSAQKISAKAPVGIFTDKQGKKEYRVD